MKNFMKKIANNEEMDIFEVATTKYDIMEIILIENATIKDRKTEQEYIGNSTFLKIKNRKGDIRVLDLISHIDITNMLDKLELLYNKKTKEKPIFIGQ